MIFILAIVLGYIFGVHLPLWVVLTLTGIWIIIVYVLTTPSMEMYRLNIPCGIMVVSKLAHEGLLSNEDIMSLVVFIFTGVNL